MTAGLKSDKVIGLTLRAGIAGEMNCSVQLMSLITLDRCRRLFFGDSCRSRIVPIKRKPLWLGQASGMNFNDWSASVVQLLTSAPIVPSPRAALRSRLVALAKAISSGPDRVNTTFIQLVESELVELTLQYWDDLSSGQISVPAIAASNENAFVLHIAAVIRAIDEYLFETGDKGPPHFPGLLDAEGCHWVIPRKWARPVDSLGPNQGFRRRGLRFHRIVPTVASGHPVAPHFLRMIGPTSSARNSKDAEQTRPVAKLSAHVFDAPHVHLSFSGEGNAKRFVATGISAKDHDAVIEAQVAEGLEQGATIMLWPELTMPPAHRKTAIAALRRAAMETVDCPQIVVLGSWHEDNDGVITNEAVVVNGLGQPQLRYSKMVPFYSAQLGTEGIALGSELPVLLAEDFVATVAICKDFCELDRLSMFLELDVDLFLVPSMANGSTMGSHKAMAKNIRVKTGGHTFVVQQPDDPKDRPGGSGWALVLPAPRDPQDAKAVEVQSVAAHVYASPCI